MFLGLGLRVLVLAPRVFGLGAGFWVSGLEFWCLGLRVLVFRA